jgi:O-antigen/teichoic acid export membrane protein
MKRSQSSFLSNLAAVFGGQAACALLALAVEVCFARLLGPVGRGQISLCMMAIAFGYLLGGLGGDIPIVVWTADPRKNPSDWLAGVLFSGLMGSAVACCAWAVAYWRWHPAVFKGITPHLADIILATIPLAISFGYLMAILSGLERFRQRAGVAIANQSGELLAFVALVLLFGRKTEMALLANFTGLAAAVVIAVILLKKFIPRAVRVRSVTDNLASSLSFGLRGQLGNLATFFTYRLDVFVINYFLDPAQVGLYALGVVVSESLWQIPQAAATALFPRTARTIDRGATEFTCAVVRQVFSIACLTGLAMAALSPLLVPLIFGARFAPSVPVIFWILPGTVALSVAKVMCADLAARGKPEFSSIFAVVALGITVLLDLFLIPRMGIQGAALASSIAYTTNATLIAITLKHQLKVRWKSLFVPSYAELALYGQLWNRMKASVWPNPTAATTGQSD